MTTFSTETKELMYEAQHGYCVLCDNNIHSFHHKLHNNKVNRKKFPLFIHSVFNCIGLCYNCHKNKAHLFTVTESVAIVYERFLSLISSNC